MMQYERFATWDEVEELRRDVREFLEVERLIYGQDELLEALYELGNTETFRGLVPFVLQEKWNDPLEKKLFFLSRLDKRAVVEAMANAMNPRG